MKFPFDEEESSNGIDERSRKEDRSESIKMAILRIKHNLDTIYKELEELERTALNDRDLIEVRDRNYDEFVKRSINKRRVPTIEKDEFSSESEDFTQPYRPSDFTKKLQDYDD